ncbi:MAG TPA: MFS transporter [Roseiflexaceae bacterium]|nr:MFS transporter [Roseiflexaceae bacterium]
MKIRQFTVLFTCNLIPLFIGMGLFPVLPIYAAQFGATRTDVGIFYAAVYVASALSMLWTGWLVARLPRRALFVAAGGVGVPALALLGQASTLWQVVALTGMVWFCGGVTLAITSVYAGESAAGIRRGRLFSLLFLAYPLAALTGGAAVGQLTARYGYTAMFAALAAFWLIQPVVGLLGLQPRAPQRQEQQSAFAGAIPPGGTFAALLISALLASAAVNIARLGSALSMRALGFPPEAAASTVTVSGLATIPLALLIGSLSDRIGRRRALALSYALTAAGAGTLLAATQLWQFQLAATLVLAAWCANRAVASAFTADVLPSQALGRAIPRLNATDSLASIAGFAATGYVMDALGPSYLYAAGVALALAAATALSRIGRHTLPPLSGQPVPALVPVPSRPDDSARAER